MASGYSPARQPPGSARAPHKEHPHRSGLDFRRGSRRLRRDRAGVFSGERGFTSSAPFYESAAVELRAAQGIREAKAIPFGEMFLKARFSRTIALKRVASDTFGCR